MIDFIYKWLIDALFPINKYAREVLDMDGKTAWAKLDRATKPVDRNMHSIFRYRDPRVTELIWHIKYKKSEKAVSIAGFALCEELLNNPAFRGGGTVIPIPITAQRMRERGYNQCHLLTDEMSRLIKQGDSGKRFLFDKELLYRAHHNSRHTLKNREQRLASAKGIFALDDRVLAGAYPDKNLQIIIVDDVITTGSTISEAMTKLREAGFADIKALSVAH